VTDRANQTKDLPVSDFEAAADAIVNGDIGKLKALLRDSPQLIRERSARDHHSTLLHYVSANGVEDFRQKTPKNIVEVTGLLLHSGAEVNAESDAYGGGSTALMLAATSSHPERAGVQDGLMAILLENGALMERPAEPGKANIVNICLANGRGAAAEFLAKRGASLDLEGAAGIGRLDMVKSFFNDDGSLRPPATENQMVDGFAWACEFGRTDVVEFLLQRGVQINRRLRHNGQAGLHWAACGGHTGTVELLLRRGSAIDAKDESYGGTPLEWALYGWANAPEDAQGYYEVVALLSRAGAKLAHEWYEGDPGRRRATEKLQADPRMRAALDQGRRST
jgi:ankyrin repeat protein